MRRTGCHALDGHVVLATLAALAALTLHFGGFPIRTQPIATDVRNFLYYADRVAAGFLPHVDSFENKPPLAALSGGLVVAAARRIGVDPLAAVRSAWLALTVLTGLLLWACLRVWTGRTSAALVGLVPLLSFPLLGQLPAIGNVPKAWMALAAAAAALLAASGRWVWAGVCAGLAILDWQIGGLVIVAVALASQTDGGERATHRRRLFQILAGMMAAVLPLAFVYAARGRLGLLLEQTILPSLARGRASMPSVLELQEWQRRLQLISVGCGGRSWLVPLALGGLLLLVVRLRRRPTGPQRRLGVALATYHCGVLLFSLVDFQGYGDLFIALHSVAMLGGLALAEATAAAAAGPPRWRAPALVLLATLAFVGTRPWEPRSAYILYGTGAPYGTDLPTQRALALGLEPLLRDPATWVVGPAELRVLTATRNPGPLVFWNRAAYFAFQRAGESEPATLARLSREAGAAHVVCDGADPRQICHEAFGEPVLVPSFGPYHVRVFDTHGPIRTPAPAFSP
jgi:hypothetical protein